MKAATLFSGGGGADLGLDAASLDVKWGLEHDDEIAQVARDNGLNIHTADVTEEDPADWPDVDVLHASPPCPNFSVAKTGGEETGEDVSLARATARFIEAIEPQLFTLENVWGYRKSRSWKLIRECLEQQYEWNAWKLNAANYGVPQTRKRMIVCARKGGPRPRKPTPTHAENPQRGGLFGEDKQEWVGWHEAIEDLIPDLPETELADWQKERLPDELLETTIVDTQPNARGDCRQQQPTKTVAADPAGGPPRAVLVHGSDTRSCPQQDEDEPSFSVIANGNEKGAGANVPRAVLVNESSTLETRQQQQPAASQVATGRNGNQRAVLVSNANTQWGDGTHEGEDPSLTVTDQHGGRLRAVLVPGWNATSFVTRGDGEPSRTISNTERVGNRDRAVLDRRVVQMTPRALARFQSFPDSYDLPDSKSLACRIIGNAVPPLAMKKWIQHLTNDA